jgi:hypothetical protein
MLPPFQHINININWKNWHGHRGSGRTDPRLQSVTTQKVVIMVISPFMLHDL